MAVPRIHSQLTLQISSEMDQKKTEVVPLLNNQAEKDTHYLYYNNVAICISTVSFFYNFLEGGVSVYFGEVSDSISLFFFGVQSFVELLSSLIVLWKVMTSYANNSSQIRREKISTLIIGVLFVFLAIGTLISGILSLINRSYPVTTMPNIIISSIATILMLSLWMTKKKIARELNSSTIQSDAQCSFACIRITSLLLFGSIVFHFWNQAWWIDAAVAIILSLFFATEGTQMIRWASSENFTGGCCGGCAKIPEEKQLFTPVKVTCSTSCKETSCDKSKGINLDHEDHYRQESHCGGSGACPKACGNEER
ncbi:MAG: cation diffusion facilitator family transporter [Bacteroidia bacterium]